MKDYSKLIEDKNVKILFCINKISKCEFKNVSFFIVETNTLFAILPSLFTTLYVFVFELIQMIDRSFIEQDKERIQCR